MNFEFLQNLEKDAKHAMEAELEKVEMELIKTMTKRFVELLEMLNLEVRRKDCTYICGFPVVLLSYPRLRREEAHIVNLAQYLKWPGVSNCDFNTNMLNLRKV
jgi:hypothetical protein